jgi:hypothetical protein
MNISEAGYGVLGMFKRALVLSDFLDLTIYRSCSDPRDKVFTLYWILKRFWNSLKEPVPESFPQPNYLQSVEEVYCQFCCLVISFKEQLASALLPSYLSISRKSGSSYYSISILSCRYGKLRAIETTGSWRPLLPKSPF